MTSGVWGTSLGQLEGKDGDGRRLRFSTLGGARSPPPPPPDPASTRRACTPTAREGAAGEEGVRTRHHKGASPREDRCAGGDARRAKHLPESASPRRTCRLRR